MKSAWFNLLLYIGMLYSMLFSISCGFGSSPQIARQVSERSAVETYILILHGGDNQEASTGMIYPDEIVFEVRDASNRPVAEKEIELRLFDITGMTALINQDYLTNIWKADSPLQGDITGLENIPEEDILGKIISEERRTNTDGHLIVEVNSSKLSARNTLLVARVASSSSAVNAFSFARLNTANNASVDSFVVTTTREQEIAGKAIVFQMEALSKDGTRASEFTGRLTFNVRHNAKASWLGLNPSMPKNQVSCAFKEGICELSGGPYIVHNAQKVRGSFANDEFSSSAKINFDVVRDDPAHIVLVKAETPPKNKAAVFGEIEFNYPDGPTQSIAMDADGDFTVYPVLVDRSGNYISHANTTTLAVTGSLSGLTATSDTGHLLSPELVGNGELTFATDDLNATIQYVVNHGALYDFETTTDLMSAAVAGVAFNLDLRARDQHGNTVLSFINSRTLSWSTQNSANNSENRSIELPEDGEYVFIEGYLRGVSIISHNSAASPIVEVSYKSSGTTYSGLTEAIVTIPNEAHHLTIMAPTQTASSMDHSATFSISLWKKNKKTSTLILSNVLLMLASISKETQTMPPQLLMKATHLSFTTAR